jgi:hypothetical protein
MPTFNPRGDTKEEVESSFYKYVEQSHCKCILNGNSTCYGYPDKKNIQVYKDDDECDVISYNDIHKDENYLQSAQTIVKMFETLGHIKKTQSNLLWTRSDLSPSFSPTKSESSPIASGEDRYYIYYYNKYYDKKKKKLLKWDNIKSLEKENPVSAKLFWYFRKAIVDCLIKHIISIDILGNDVEPIELKIYAVGSVKLTSDYDLTIYSNPTTTVHIIRKFQEYFTDIFGDASSDVFDTNLYGKGFVEFRIPKDNKELLKMYLAGYIQGQCENKTFLYVKEDQSYDDSQLMWALIKFVESVKKGLGEDIYTQVFEYFNKGLNVLYDTNASEDGQITHLQIADKRYEYLKNIAIKYQDILIYQDQMSNDTYTDKNIIKTTDFISLVSFFGVETYFTRGTFMDIVINNQTCKTSPKKMELRYEDYLNSIIENASFFLTHNEKDKYLMRVYNSLKSIHNFSIVIDESIKEFEQLDKEIKEKNPGKDNSGKICSNINHLNFSRDCIKPKIFQFLLKLVYRLLRLYLTKKLGLHGHPHLSYLDVEDKLDEIDVADYYYESNIKRYVVDIPFKDLDVEKLNNYQSQRSSNSYVTSRRSSLDATLTPKRSQVRLRSSTNARKPEFI